MLGIIRKTFHLIGRDRRGRWIALVVLAVFASALEMGGAVLVYVLLALVADPGSTVDLPLVGDLRALGGDTEQSRLLLGMAILMAVFFATRAVVQVGVSYAQQRVAHNAGARLAKQLAAGYLALPYAFHLQRNTADLIRNTNGAVITVVGQAFLPIIRVTADAILTLSLLTVMLVISPLATGLAILVVGGAAAILLKVVQPRLKELGHVTHDMTRRSIGTLQQSLHGLRDIKVLGRERYFAREFARIQDRLARASYLRGTVGELPRQVMETALIAFILAFFVLAVATGAAGDQFLSVLGVFAYAGLRLQPSLNRAVKGINELRFSTAAVEDVYRDLQIVEDLKPALRDASRRSFEKDVSLQDVRFRYENATDDALSHVDLTIQRGETIGIAGPSGSGKTTLVDLITGLLEPTSGRLLIDGEDLREDVRGWQGQLGVVPQMVFLIDDTLRRNIALGLRDDEIDEDSVQEAVRLAQLQDFISRVPEGLDAVVGERGVRISGGQRQRIAIARALYSGASVLIFDEGTSALDNATEWQLMKALEDLRGEYTILLVAHRLSTVRSCDRIVYLENGRVEGLGPYEELLRDSPGFRALAHSS